MLSLPRPLQLNAPPLWKKKKRKRSFIESPSCHHAQASFSLSYVLVLIPGCQLVKKSLIMLKTVKKKEGRCKKAQEKCPWMLSTHLQHTCWITSSQLVVIQNPLTRVGFDLVFYFSLQQKKNLQDAPVATTASGSSLANTSSSEGSSFPLFFFFSFSTGDTKIQPLPSSWMRVEGLFESAEWTEIRALRCISCSSSSLHDLYTFSD